MAQTGFRVSYGASHTHLRPGHPTGQQCQWQGQPYVEGHSGLPTSAGQWQMCKRHRIWGLETWFLPALSSSSHLVSPLVQGHRTRSQICPCFYLQGKGGHPELMARNQIRDANRKSREHEKRAEHPTWWSFLCTSHHKTLVLRECLHLAPT